MIKNPSLQELELKLKDYQTVANSDGLSVGLKFDKEMCIRDRYRYVESFLRLPISVASKT